MKYPPAATVIARAMMRSPFLMRRHSRLNATSPADRPTPRSALPTPSRASPPSPVPAHGPDRCWPTGSTPPAPWHTAGGRVEWRTIARLAARTPPRARPAAPRCAARLYAETSRAPSARQSMSAVSRRDRRDRECSWLTLTPRDRETLALSPAESEAAVGCKTRNSTRQLQAPRPSQPLAPLGRGEVIVLQMVKNRRPKKVQGFGGAFGV